MNCSGAPPPKLTSETGSSQVYPALAVIWGKYALRLRVTLASAALISSAAAFSAGLLSRTRWIAVSRVSGASPAALTAPAAPGHDNISAVAAILAVLASLLFFIMELWFVPLCLFLLLICNLCARNQDCRNNQLHQCFTA